MKASDLLDELQSALDETKKQGHSTVSIDAFKNYLAGLAKDVEDDSNYKSLEHESKLTAFKAQNDINIATINNENAHSIEMFKSVITAGQSALKASMIINGGAAAAVLAFTGKIWETSTSIVVANSLASTIILFCLGVLCAAFASGVTYLSQFFYAGDYNKTGSILNGLAIFTVLGSYILFAVGAVKAGTSLSVHFGL